MRRRHLGFLLIGLFGLTFFSPAPAMERVSGVSQWDFDVYLNDRKIGKHLFKVSESAGIKQVQSEIQIHDPSDSSLSLRAQRGRALVE